MNRYGKIKNINFSEIEINKGEDFMAFVKGKVGTCSCGLRLRATKERTYQSYRKGAGWVRYIKCPSCQKESKVYDKEPNIFKKLFDW